MTRYARYKPTGIPWLPEVPEEWDFLPLKSLFKSTFSGSWGADVAQGERGTVCYRMADFDYEHGVVSDSKLTYRSYKGSELQGKMLAVGDLLIEKSGGGDVSPVGRVVRVVSDRRATCSNFIQQVRCRDGINSSFVCYLFAALYARRLTRYYFNQTTGIQNLKVSRYLSVKVPMPSTIIQNAIVSFLDSKCGKIDRLVAAKEKEVALLKELKQSMIAEAVTGRTSNRPMKPSGIPWLPEVPEGWEVKTLRQLLKMVSRKGFPEKRLLSVTREQGVIVRDVESKEENHNFIPDDLSNYKLVEIGDFAINKMKSWQGSYGVSDYEGIVSPAYYVCRLSGVNRKFFSIAIRSRIYVSFLARFSKGIRVDQWDLSPIGLKEIPFLFPPLPEQREIAAYIAARAAKIDAAVGKLEAEVTALKEYRERLVADVVTGQRKVA